MASLRATILFLFIGVGAGASLPRGHGRANSCKSIPGDAGWPSAEKWNALNKTVGGRLIATVPLPSVCHLQPFGTFDEEKCAAMKTAWLSDPTL
jgi:hypothetical protein